MTHSRQAELKKMLEARGRAIQDQVQQKVRAFRDTTTAEVDRTEAERAKLAVVAALGDAEVGDFGTGQVTYFETTKKEHVVKATSFRTLRMKGFK